jgi:hypothetical protein
LNNDIKVLFKREAGHETYLFLILATAKFVAEQLFCAVQTIKENNSTLQDKNYYN